MRLNPKSDVRTTDDLHALLKEFRSRAKGNGKGRGRVIDFTPPGHRFTPPGHQVAFGCGTVPPCDFGRSKRGGSRRGWRIEQTPQFERVTTLIDMLKTAPDCGPLCDVIGFLRGAIRQIVIFGRQDMAPGDAELGLTSLERIADVTINITRYVTIFGGKSEDMCLPGFFMSRTDFRRLTISIEAVLPHAERKMAGGSLDDLLLAIDWMMIASDGEIPEALPGGKKKCKAKAKMKKLKAKAKKRKAKAKARRKAAKARRKERRKLRCGTGKDHKRDTDLPPQGVKNSPDGPQPRREDMDINAMANQFVALNRRLQKQTLEFKKKVEPAKTAKQLASSGA